MTKKDTNHSLEEELAYVERFRLLRQLLKINLSLSDILSLTFTRLDLSRILYLNHIYQLVLNKPGVVMEFGVYYGATLSILQKLRAIYEPFNYLRKIIGFDTFTGFANDLTSYEKNKWKKGDYKVTPGYEKILEKILFLEEKISPINHLKKFQLIKGEASITVKDYLKKNKETVIGMAIFDMDIYKPTKEVIKAIKPRLFKGSVLVFDELNHPSFPGETQAVIEEIGLKNLKLNSFHGYNGGCWAEII